MLDGGASHMNGGAAWARATLCGLYKYTGTMFLHEHLAHLCGQQFMTILLFHRVTDLIPEDGLTVHPRRFRDFCSMLARRFNVVSLGEIFRILREGRPMPPRTVAITFDDSYRDNLEAGQFLHGLGLPATFFVPTGFVGTERVFDWDRALPRLPNLTWEDVRELVRLGHEIGSHTVNHVNLGVVTDDQARTELVTSRVVLEDRLQQPVHWFAYPFGGPHHLRPDLLPVIQEAGYEGTLSAFGGFVRPGRDARVLPREAVPYFRSALHLEMHLSGCLHWLYALQGRDARQSRSPWPYQELEEQQASQGVLSSAVIGGP
jgi:peptidoglycan/xylan/chitin deacetylase (PgdA/CDA1 family)